MPKSLRQSRSDRLTSHLQVRHFYWCPETCSEIKGLEPSTWTSPCMAMLWTLSPRSLDPSPPTPRLQVELSPLTAPFSRPCLLTYLYPSKVDYLSGTYKYQRLPYGCSQGHILRPRHGGWPQMATNPRNLIPDGSQSYRHELNMSKIIPHRPKPAQPHRSY